LTCFFGTAQESDEGCILGGFLENDDFSPSGRPISDEHTFLIRARSAQRAQTINLNVSREGFGKSKLIALADRPCHIKVALPHYLTPPKSQI
jgi:hypothetical protein